MKKLACLVFSVCFLQLVVQSQSEFPISTPEAQGFSSARLKRIDENVQKWLTNKWLSNAAVLITRNGKIVYHKSFGFDNSETNTPLQNNQLFRLASQTKAVTSVGIMTLYEEGKLMLDDSVAAFIPEFANGQVLDKFNPADSTFTTVKAMRPITIRDLLTHTSGIGYAQIGSPAANAIYAKNDITAGIALPSGTIVGDAMTSLGKLPLMHQPGKQFTYGLNTDLLGYVIEKVSGMKLDQFFRTRIFDPLGMNDTWFYLPKSLHPRLTKLNIDDGKGLRSMGKDYKFNGTAMKADYPAETGTYFSGGAGLTSSITDYAKFLQMLLNGGIYNGSRLLAPHTVNMMISNQIGDLNLGSQKFGLGFSIATEKSAAELPQSVGTFGWGGAFGTNYWVDPKEQITAQIYTQIWGRRQNVDEEFKVLVYQALTK